METLEFMAMGSPCRLVVDGGHRGLVTEAHELLDRLERRWSRFLPESDISLLNRHAGDFVVMSPETFELVARANEARELTAGRFNPLMLVQLTRLGYDRPWQERPSVLGRTDAGCDAYDVEVSPASSEPITLLDAVNAARIPVGTAFDPGGVGKGLAADLVTEFLVAGGATCTSVELGGDLRVSGDPWYGPTWRIAVADPYDDGAEVAAFTPTAGAIATSSTLRRRWTAGGEERHHLLDPASGRPAITDLVAVTTCAATTWWAEVAAKVALMAGSSKAIGLLDSFGTPGVAVAADGRISSTNTQPTVARATFAGEKGVA